MVKIWKTASLRSAIIKIVENKKSILDDKLLVIVKKQFPQITQEQLILALFDLEVAGKIHVERISKERFLVSIVEKKYLSVSED